jgi:hypothetical protein
VPTYAIEICGPHNECVSFPPAGEVRVRGRWEFAKVAHRDLGEVMKTLAATVSVIPGQYLVLDTEKREAAVFEPLRDTPAGREILEKINGVYAKFPDFSGKQEAKQTKVLRDLSLDAVKTWAAEMAKVVAAGNAVNVPGNETLPTLDEIRAKWPGRRMADPHNTGRQEKDLQKWVDPVPESKGQKQLAGTSGGNQNNT